MIFKLRFELTSHDLAIAVTRIAERRGGSTEQIEAWISSRRKKEIREAGHRTLVDWGDPSKWPEPAEESLYACARKRIIKLWPKGA